MSDDEADPELLDLLRKSLGIGGSDPNAPPDTKVLQNAELIYNNSIDVALDMRHTKVAAIAIHEEMQKRTYSTKTWSEHPLHPQAKDEATLNFIFTMDLLNFSFWSEKSEKERFCVAYGETKDGEAHEVPAIQTAEKSTLDEKREDVDKLRRELEELRRGLEEAKIEGEKKVEAARKERIEAEVDLELRVDEKPENGLMDLQQPVVGDALEPRPIDPKLSEQIETQRNDEVEEQLNKVMGEEGIERTDIDEAEIATQENDQTQGVESKHLKRWTGYSSLVAALQRALDENIPITTPSFWTDEEACPDSLLRQVFRSASSEEIPMFTERVQCLREAGQILIDEFDGSVAVLIDDAKQSAARLVNLLADRFPCFNDTATFERKKVRFLKRAQIFVADVWAAFNGEAYGEFHDIDAITMFADYRVPQMLHSLGVMGYAPPLEGKIRRGELLPAGGNLEVQIRGCSIWAVELIRREIVKLDPEAEVNAILIDFFLYDLAKERESKGEESIPHHRTRSIWY